MYKKWLYSKCVKIIKNISGIDSAKKFDTKLRFGRKLNLKSPKTLADKVAYIELHDQSPLASDCTDKYAVREYLTDKGLEDILVPLVGGPWNSSEEIDFSSLTDSFVLKATHGCKMNYIVQDKSDLDLNKCRNAIDAWLKIKYGTYSVEPHYEDIKPRIYAEKYLGEMSDMVDYKIHCLNGVPQFVLTTSNRNIDEDGSMSVSLDIFDMEWNPIFEIEDYKNEKAGNGNVKKPKNFDEMKRIAEKLSADFKFVRVDLYEIEDRVLFGELTFSPACCVFPYFTEKFLSEMGEKLQL